MHLRRFVLSAVLLAAIAFPFAWAPDVSAAPGDYTVRLTSTSGTHWATYGGPPFVTVPTRVYTGLGYFSQGDYKAWRVVVPGEGSRIVGGHVTATIATPDAPVRGRILVGSANTPTVLYDGDGTGTVNRTITGGAFDWMQFDLRTTTSLHTTKLAENTITLAAAELVLRDSVPPTIAPIMLPSPTRWYGGEACIPFAIRITDQGGGLLRSQVRRASDGLIVTSLAAPQVESPKPGPNEQRLEDCIQPHERVHGDTTYVATVWDVGGAARELTFSVRADHVAPTLQGGPADGMRFATSQPQLSYEVADVGSGVAGVSASVDGASVSTTVTAGTVRLGGGPWSIGSHVVTVSATDGGGNTTWLRRSYTVADTASPTLTLIAPGSRGDATAWLSVRASDELSGIDPTSWLVTVNGEAIATTGDASSLTSSVGPLSPGTHEFVVRVSDRAGNVATLRHDYEVVGSTVPSMPDIGARTGVFVVHRPASVVTFGSRVAASLFVSRNGRPMSNQTVELRRGGTLVASASSNVDGVAALTFRAGAPGAYRASVVGMDVDPADVPLKIAPRLIVTTSVARTLVGRRVIMRGKILPAIRGRRVAVEARIGGVWYPVRRAATTAANGSFATWVVPTTPGRVWVRVRLLAVGSWSAAVSNERELVVRRSASR